MSQFTGSVDSCSAGISQCAGSVDICSAAEMLQFAMSVVRSSVSEMIVSMHSAGVAVLLSACVSIGSSVPSAVSVTG